MPWQAKPLIRPKFWIASFFREQGLKFFKKKPRPHMRATCLNFGMFLLLFLSDFFSSPDWVNPFSSSSWQEHEITDINQAVSFEVLIQADCNCPKCSCDPFVSFRHVPNLSGQATKCLRLWCGGPCTGWALCLSKLAPRKDWELTECLVFSARSSGMASACFVKNILHILRLGETSWTVFLLFPSRLDTKPNTTAEVFFRGEWSGHFQVGRWPNWGSPAEHWTEGEVIVV